MSKDKRKKNGKAENGLHGPNASAKHASHQMNGETHRKQADMISLIDRKNGHA